MITIVFDQIIVKRNKYEYMQPSRLVLDFTELVHRVRSYTTVSLGTDCEGVPNHEGR
jgi:hypothetical protein